MHKMRENKERAALTLGRVTFVSSVENEIEKIHCVLETRFGIEFEGDLDGRYKKMNIFFFCLEQMIQDCSVWKRRRIVLSWRGYSWK